MKGLLNLESISALVMFLFTFFMARSFIKRKNQLGYCEIQTITSLGQSNLVMAIPLLFIMVFLFINKLSYSSGASDYVFFIFLPLSFIIFLVFSYFQAKFPKGLYAHGIATAGGIILYSEITKYNFGQLKNGNVRFAFNGSTRYIIETSVKEAQDIKHMLKKKCKFKK